MSAACQSMFLRERGADAETTYAYAARIMKPFYEVYREKRVDDPRWWWYASEVLGTIRFGSRRCARKEFGLGASSREGDGIDLADLSTPRIATSDMPRFARTAGGSTRRNAHRSRSQ